VHWAFRQGRRPGRAKKAPTALLWSLLSQKALPHRNHFYFLCFLQPFVVGEELLVVVVNSYCYLKGVNSLKKVDLTRTLYANLIAASTLPNQKRRGLEMQVL
jgi:hypothetical protein